MLIFFNLACKGAYWNENAYGIASVTNTYGTSDQIIKANSNRLQELLGKNNGDKIRITVLGDSVTRMLLSTWIRQYGFKSGVQSGQSYNRDSVKYHCQGRQQKCEFDSDFITGTFFWLNWLQSPQPIPVLGGAPRGVQAEDYCTRFQSIHSCFGSIFTSNTPDLVLVRGGLQYLLYNGIHGKSMCEEISQFNSSFSFESGCNLPYEDLIATHLPLIISTLKELFRGKIIWLLLQPLSVSPTACYDPIRSIGAYIFSVNAIMEPILSAANISVIDPYSRSATFNSLDANQGHGFQNNENWVPFQREFIGYYDCLHYADPMTTLILDSVLKIALNESISRVV